MSSCQRPTTICWKSVDRMKARDHIEAVILGGTEFPLLLREPQHNGIPLLDTTRIHVNRIVAELVS
jgi:aspartate racemase